MIDPKGLLFGILGRSPVNFLVRENFSYDRFWNRIRFPKRKELRLTGSRVPRKADFPKRKESLLKKIDSDKSVRGQFSVRNFRSYFINFSARENFIKKDSILTMNLAMGAI